MVRQGALARELVVGVNNNNNRESRRRRSSSSRSNSRQYVRHHHSLRAIWLLVMTLVVAIAPAAAPAPAPALLIFQACCWDMEEEEHVQTKAETMMKTQTHMSMSTSIIDATITARRY